MKKHVYIVHGGYASPTKHWFPWLKEKVRADGHQASVLRMPNSSDAKKEEWVGALADEIKFLDPDTYFVTHSLACMTLLNYLDGLDSLTNVGGFILVSGYAEPLAAFPTLDPFTAKKVDHRKIISATASRAVKAAKDDYMCPFELTMKLSEQLDASFYPVENGGHFRDVDGFVTFPLVYAILNEMMNVEQ
ncbi:alpha/beta hydrolase [Paenibacillus sp. UNC496MF]|uniref:RBBP9/YdeN family alpha/beta hydrolase n=1 Tax=Paenibacillus sp. UNC496MF TaxID=1502753 RepID=UPI000B82BB87|nr:alpha/beta hydrolase [Paenibacillus sp. UNC496MF]